MEFWTNVAIRGDHVLLRGVDSDGKRFNTKIKYKPTLYVPCRKDEATHASISGDPVRAVQMDSISSGRDFLKEGGPSVHGYDRFQYAFLAETYSGKVEYDVSKIRVANIDIETMADGGFPNVDDPDKEITAITLRVAGSTIVFGCKPYSPSEGVTYVLCRDETDLLTKFVAAWSADWPDIVTGWNIEFFDLPYLVGRITKVVGAGTAKNLSPWGILTDKTVFSNGKDRKTYAPLGVSVLDYQRLYHKLAVMTRAVDTPDDYKLNTVAAAEVGEKKIDYSEYESLHELYLRDWQKYVDYNVHDVMLVEKINDRRQLIELVIAMTYNAKVNFEDMLGSVRAWECIIHHWLLEKGVVLPPRTKATARDLVGAYVKDPAPSGYDWVASFDLNSLYSHLIMQWNISPETRVGTMSAQYTVDDVLNGVLARHREKMVEADVIVSPNMQLFTRKKKGFLPLILEEMYAERVKAKESMLTAQRSYEKTKDERFKAEEARWKNMDKVHKTNLNAAYGVLTNQYFIFYDHANAEAITTSGQLAIRWVERKINEFMNRTLGTHGVDYIIAGDTDSVYVHLDPLVKKVFPEGASKERVTDFLVKLCDGKMEEVIEEAYVELARMVNASEQKMKMKREAIADRGIWLGKKHYILNMIDKEGVRFAEPKIEIKGMAAVKSSTPPACRAKIRQAIKIIMNGKESDVQVFISDFRKEFDHLPFHDIAFPRGVSDLEKWEDSVGMYKPGTPIQVRAALLYNNMIKTKNLRHYPEIYGGDKIKFAYLLTPNPITENVFGTTGPLVPGIEDYIDRDVMFDKGFLTPLKSIMNAIGFSAETSDGASLEDFF